MKLKLLCKAVVRLLLTYRSDLGNDRVRNQRTHNN